MTLTHTIGTILLIFTAPEISSPTKSTSSGPPASRHLQIRNLHFTERNLLTGKATVSAASCMNFGIIPKHDQMCRIWRFHGSKDSAAIFIFCAMTCCSTAGGYQHFTAAHYLNFQSWKCSQQVPLKLWYCELMLWNLVLFNSTDTSPQLKLHIPTVTRRENMCPLMALTEHNKNTTKTLYWIVKPTQSVSKATSHIRCVCDCQVICPVFRHNQTTPNTERRDSNSIQHQFNTGVTKLWHSMTTASVHQKYFLQCFEDSLIKDSPLQHYTENDTSIDMKYLPRLCSHLICFILKALIASRIFIFMY